MDFVLDVAKWRCGNDGDYRLGEGQTELLNPEGYLCCLGQVALQCMEISESDILEKLDPETIFLADNIYPEVVDTILTREIDKEDTRESWKGRLHHRLNSDLSKKAITINDNREIDNTTRVTQLVSLFKAHGHTLTVINDHLL